MAAWASETTLDVEYAHTIAPGATLVLAEKYVVAHHLGDVISQSFIATEQGIGSAAIRALRGAYTAAYAHHVTVLSGSGDTGAAGLERGGTASPPTRCGTTPTARPRNGWSTGIPGRTG